MKRGDVVKIEDLNIGDRFHFTKNRTVYQICEPTIINFGIKKKKVIQIKKDKDIYTRNANLSELNATVVFLRSV